MTINLTMNITQSLRAPLPFRSTLALQHRVVVVREADGQSRLTGSKLH